LKYFISIFLNETMGFSFGNVLSRELLYSGAFRRFERRGIKTCRGLNDVLQLNQTVVFPPCFHFLKNWKKVKKHGLVLSVS